MKLQILIVSCLVRYAMAAAVPEANLEADAGILEDRAIGSFCQQSSGIDKGTCQKESWCKAAAQIGVVSTGDCPNDPANVKCCYIPDLVTARDQVITNAACTEGMLWYAL
ncbi:uncharacterized protein RSE6_12185 [Rhynchosporium secalis]|uniref:Uncharacterized protein n=1 Tax=Rhynchosporium secalis TaxID=38038 RepID=A0A1E1MPV6_RHYSE|nr:uncharacterized protein RSE6_12185 [Rhynchosporium secalis]